MKLRVYDYQNDVLLFELNNNSETTEVNELLLIDEALVKLANDYKFYDTEEETKDMLAKENIFLEEAYFTKDYEFSFSSLLHSVYKFD
jgi:hypothetical protein